MPSPEYERWCAMTNEEYDEACRRLGLGGHSGERREYQARINRMRELAITGEGPGAWAERFHHECDLEDRGNQDTKGLAGGKRQIIPDSGETARGSRTVPKHTKPARTET